MPSSTCFTGQPTHDGISYRIDPGRRSRRCTGLVRDEHDPDSGLRNAEIALTPPQLLDNVHQVQQSREPAARRRSSKDSKAAPGAPNLDIEMETGTGKTYVYIKTIMELHKRYGWSKFIVVVPSVAIREGVKKSFDITAEHFQQTLRHEAAHRSSTTRRSCTSWSGSAPTPACR